MGMLWVFLGGGLGASCRYLVSRLVPQIGGFGWPTLISNILACLILGYLMTGVDAKSLTEKQQLFLMTGFCGGFSTFSTFTIEHYNLLQNGQYKTAVLYIALSLIACLGGLILGIRLGTSV